MTIESTPPGLPVTMGGRPRGVTPLTLGKITPGRHDVLVGTRSAAGRRDGGRGGHAPCAPLTGARLQPLLRRFLRWSVVGMRDGRRPRLPDGHRLPDGQRGAARLRPQPQGVSGRRGHRGTHRAHSPDTAGPGIGPPVGDAPARTTPTRRGCCTCTAMAPTSARPRTSSATKSCGASGSRSSRPNTLDSAR